jgi:hypothetical protein
MVVVWEKDGVVNGIVERTRQHELGTTAAEFNNLIRDNLGNDYMLYSNSFAMKNAT